MYTLVLYRLPAYRLTVPLVVQLYYLDRDELWETVKPYNFHYFPKSEVPLHNLLRSPHTTRVRNLRPLAPLLALDLQGFELHHLRTRMKYQDFKDESLIENVYVPELENYFGKLLGAKRVRALDFQVCAFPLGSSLRC